MSMDMELFKAITQWRGEISAREELVRIDRHANGREQAFPRDAHSLASIKAAYAYNALCDFQREIVK